MKGLPFTLLALLILSACSSTQLSREEQWAFFEYWDPDHNLRLDVNEFTRGYDESKFFHEWAGRKTSIGNSALVAQLDNANGGLKRKLTSRADRNGVASAKSVGSNASDDQAKDSLSAFVAEADMNKDDTVTKDEWARAMFDVADENHDQAVSPIEFYVWQLLRA